MPVFPYVSRTTLEFERILEEVRLSTKSDADSGHFWKRARERGVNPFDIEALRHEGDLVRIQSKGVRSDPKSLKCILRRKGTNGKTIEGVFVIDGYNLRGITVYVVYP